MAIVSCTSCGAQIDDTSRFCRSCGRNRIVIILLAAAVGLLLFLLVAVVYVMLRSNSAPIAPPAISTPTVPPPPGAPAPPFAPPAIGDAVVGEELIYPGAREVMTVSAEGKGVLHLQTTDPASRVVDWYTARLKPTQHIRLPGGSAILRSGDIAVVIGSGDSETSIMITRGDDDEAPPAR